MRYRNRASGCRSLISRYWRTIGVKCSVGARPAVSDIGAKYTGPFIPAPAGPWEEADLPPASGWAWVVDAGSSDCGAAQTDAGGRSASRDPPSSPPGPLGPDLSGGPLPGNPILDPW